MSLLSSCITNKESFKNILRIARQQNLKKLEAPMEVIARLTDREWAEARIGVLGFKPRTVILELLKG